MEDIMGRRQCLFLSVVTLVLLLPALVRAQAKDDTVVYALQSDVQNWDPPNSVLRESIILGYHVFDHLAARDLKTGKVGPSLATSWRTLDDTTREVKLRQGVKFHDGTAFTARDVKATFDRVLDPEKKLTARGNHAKIKSVEVVDDHTVRVKTDGPYPLFVERMGAHVELADPQDGDAPARPGGPDRPEPLHRPARAPGGEPRRRHGRDHQARPERPGRPDGDDREPDGPRLRCEPQALPTGRRRRQEAPRGGRLPERLRGGLPANGAGRGARPAANVGGDLRRPRQDRDP